MNTVNLTSLVDFFPTGDEVPGLSEGDCDLIASRIDEDNGLSLREDVCLGDKDRVLFG